MTFQANELRAVGGEIYSHVFENRRTGIARDAYWSVAIDFAPFLYGNTTFRCNATVDWLQLGKCDFRNIVQHRINLPDASHAEASFYMTEHDNALSTSMSLSYIDYDRFHVELEMIVDFHGYIGDDANPAMRVAGSTELLFTGLIVVPGNLDPKPADETAVIRTASQFLDLSGYDPPLDHGFRYLFRPKKRK